MKTVLITAGANGIGLTMALAFQAAGYRVWVTDVDAPMIASLPAGIRGSHVDAGHEMGMEALFADLPSVISNTQEIAKRCNLSLVLGKPQLPEFPTPCICASTALLPSNLTESATLRVISPAFPFPKLLLLKKEPPRSSKFFVVI